MRLTPFRPKLPQWSAQHAHSVVLLFVRVRLPRVLRSFGSSSSSVNLTYTGYVWGVWVGLARFAWPAESECLSTRLLSLLTRSTVRTNPMLPAGTGGQVYSQPFRLNPSGFRLSQLMRGWGIIAPQTQASALLGMSEPFECSSALFANPSGLSNFRKHRFGLALAVGSMED